MWFLEPGTTIEQVVIKILALLIIIFLILPFHEFAHGFIAYKLGDNTAKYQGRLSLNPLRHIDPLGTLVLLITGCFGWAKPVPIDSSNFKNVRLATALTALAGPTSNLIAALLGGFLFNAIRLFSGSINIDFYNLIVLFFYFYIYANVGLAIFNLLPISPLDGSMILSSLLPKNISDIIFRNGYFAMIITFVLIFSGILTVPLTIANNFIFNFIIKITSLPFGL